VRDGLTAVLLDAEGPHFSFGASVEEHLPRALRRDAFGAARADQAMLDYPVPILVAIAASASAADWSWRRPVICCSPHPMPSSASPKSSSACSLRPPRACCRSASARAPRGSALSGRSIDAEEAARLGLVHEVADDPEAAALAYFERHLAPQERQPSLRFASRRRARNSPPVSRPGSTRSSGSTSTD
jgi:cyclohexa-1,5-dienecarbonyl-CoA hydratase